MSEVLKLEAIKGKPHDGLVPLIEDMLRLAKEGNLVNFAFVAESVKGSIFTGKSFNPDKSNVFGVIGALFALQMDIKEAFIETDEENREY